MALQEICRLFWFFFAERMHTQLRTLCKASVFVISFFSEMMDTNGVKIGNENGNAVETSDEILTMKNKNTSLSSQFRNITKREPTLRKTSLFVLFFSKKYFFSKLSTQCRRCAKI